MKQIARKTVGHLTVSLSEDDDALTAPMRIEHRNGTVIEFDLMDFDRICVALAELDRTSYQSGFRNGRTNVIRERRHKQ